MAGKPKNFIPQRSFVLVAVCIVLWIALIIRLSILQFVEYEKYQSGVINNVQKETTVAAQRGTIYARDGQTPLAMNETVWRIFISPRDIADDSQAKFISENLSRILDVDYNNILERAGRKNRADETIKRNVEEEQANMVRAFIEENRFTKQIHLEASTKRSYPYGSLAAHVIGCVGTDGGSFGLELQYDTDLKGIPGRYITARTGMGKRMPFKYDTFIEGQNGVDLVTTIDVITQNMLEEQLKNTFIDSMANNRVTGIIMDCNTGGILAMATFPDFDLNSPYTLDEYSQAVLDDYEYPQGTEEYSRYYNNLLYSMWKNKAVSELYEPGSTFKIMTAAAALEEDVVKLTDTFDCIGSLRIEGYRNPIHCHRRYGHGLGITFRYGIQQSCNPVLMTVASRLGREKFYEYFKAFGYTEKTGIDLPGEAASIYHSYGGFNQVELAVYSFGQTFKVTPIQQLTAVCAVANGGYLVKPHLVSAFLDNNGNVLKTFDTEIKRQVISEEVCKVLADVLEEGVSKDGGAKNAYVAGYKIAAKTGTSEVRDVLNEAGEAYLRIGSCVAYAPADDPQIAIIIIVDQPQCENIFGSVVAAPYIAKLMDGILPGLGIDRQYTPEEQAKQIITIPSVVGWSLNDAVYHIGTTRKIKYEPVGNGDIVSRQIPEAGEQMSRDGTVYLYTGDAVPENTVTVPNVIGATAATANSRLSRLGFNIHVDGSANLTVGTGAVVVSQSPAPDTMVPKGTVVTITMRYLDGTE
ncbi:MAG: penicillin-binding transpeptidase domain-containing protein [Oscillospiraceae bacterium]|nr:penicillin-binding transpeptidase domain-containing protein [Oscillospiraceae bacterium]